MMRLNISKNFLIKGLEELEEYYKNNEDASDECENCPIYKLINMSGPKNPNIEKIIDQGYTNCAATFLATVGSLFGETAALESRIQLATMSDGGSDIRFPEEHSENFINLLKKYMGYFYEVE